MVKSKEEDVTPGVTFIFERSTISTNALGKRVMVVELSATLPQDADVPAVEATLVKGFRIHTSPTFYAELMAALREENLVLEKKLELLETAHRVALEQNRSMKASLSVLQVQLEGGVPDEDT